MPLDYSAFKLAPRPLPLPPEFPPSRTFIEEAETNACLRLISDRFSQIQQFFDANL
jgi:hypothetical protein